MTDLNLQLFHWINLDPRALPLWFWLARFASTFLPSALLVVFTGVLCRRDEVLRRRMLRVLLAMLLAWGVARGLSAGWPVPRPFVLGLGHQWLDHKPTPSFPSSHASVAFAFGLTLWRLIRQPVARWVPLLLALLVAWSRIALGLHFPADVVAGAVVGGLGAWVALRGLVPHVPQAVLQTSPGRTMKNPARVA